jgi:hypothetical protein
MSVGNMDAMTPLGRTALQQAERALRSIEDFYNGAVKFVPFADHQPADVDGFVMKKGIVTGIYEIKARDMSAADLFSKFRGEWLISHDKLAKALVLCRSLRVNFTGFVVLIPDGIVLAQTIYEADGSSPCGYRVEQTDTRATVNGGKASRLNAYVPMLVANQYRVNPF